jgi:hypothetical protein
MGIAFQGFKGNPMQAGLIWQEVDNLFPYTCGYCRKDFPNGGKRFIASSLNRMDHSSAGCRCEDCNNGIDPNRKKAPKYAERRTELD